MLLVDYQIKSLCENQNLIEPFDPALVNPSSIDIRLGRNLIVHRKGDSWFKKLLKTLLGLQHTIVEPFEETIDISDCSKDDPYVLEPNQFVLAQTLEYLNLPPNIAVELKLKSSRAREGLSHALAGWVDNGFHGVLTLELKNYSTEKPVYIYPRLRIGQLILHQTDLPNKTYVNGRYAGFKTVQGSLDE